MLKLLSFLELDLILIIAGSVVAAIGVICAVVAVLSAVKNGKMVEKSEKTDAGSSEVLADEYLEEIEVKDNSLVLARNVIYSVGHNGQIARGKYTVQNAIEDGGAFNIRFNGLVREMQSGTQVALAEGDTICCVSGSALLSSI